MAPDASNPEQPTASREVDQSTAIGAGPHQSNSRRRCPRCGENLAGRGVLTRCPACGQSFLEAPSSGKANLAGAMRLIGPWIAAGGLFAIWRLTRADSRDPRETVDWFILALTPIGVAAWGLGWWLGKQARDNEPRP